MMRLSDGTLVVPSGYAPEDAIRMVKEIPNFPGGDRADMWVSLPELLTWHPQSDVAKPYPPKGGPT